MCESCVIRPRILSLSARFYKEFQPQGEQESNYCLEGVLNPQPINMFCEAHINFNIVSFCVRENIVYVHL
jgi:hypothetical protein